MIKSLLIIPALLFTASCFAQGVLQVEKKEVTLKNVKASETATTAVYKLKNAGNQPIIINRVSPMSGLLTPEWDKSPITPGQSRELKISFPSTQTPEKFSYAIQIFSNASNSREEVRLNAEIVDNPEKPELLYRHSLDGLKFKTNAVQFNKVYTWQVVSDTLPFLNTRPDSVTIGTHYIPSHLTLKTIPEKVAPGQRGMLIITFDAPKKNDYGYTYESIVLSINKNSSYQNRVSVTAEVSEDFSKLSPKQLANAPVATFDKTSIEFGDIKPGEKATCDFSISNTGKSDLMIRKTKASCGCTAVTLGQTTLAPGQSTVVRAIFDSAGKTGRQYKSITVITNDPKSPEQILTISGNIK